MKKMMTGARFIAETVHGYGITHVFFVEAVLRKALVEMEALGIQRVLAHTEKSAAYMADGYARMRRGPGICMCQSVGAANLAAGLQDAFLGHSPVIALTGRAMPAYRYRNAYQELLHGPMFDPVTKFNAYVDNAEQLPYLLRQAFRDAVSGAPGPVHLDVVGHVGQGTDNWETGMDVAVEEAYTKYPPNRTVPASDMLQKAADALKKAKKPVIVAGGGTGASSARDEITAIAEQLSVPVATSLNGKGAIPENHPLSLGVTGSYARWCATKVVSEADLVLFVGSRTGDMVTNHWRAPSITTPVIQIDIDPSELGRSYPDTIGLQGDAKATLKALIEYIEGAEKKLDWAGYAKGVVDQWREETTALRMADNSPMRPERLCRELENALPHDAVLVTDTGYSSIWTGVMLEMNHPEQRYIRAAGSLGWGLPASLGVKCAAPDKPVICFTGDGGLWYHIAELETAVRCGIKTVTVLNNNRCFSQCVVGVHKAYGERAGKPEEMYRFAEVRFDRLAEEMGCLGIRVEKPEDIAGALKTALQADRPALVEVITDPEYKAPWVPAY